VREPVFPGIEQVLRVLHVRATFPRSQGISSLPAEG
jgi:hypothetical protein